MIYGEYNHCPTRLISGSLLDLPHHQRHMSAIILGLRLIGLSQVLQPCIFWSHLESRPDIGAAAYADPIQARQEKYTVRQGFCMILAFLNHGLHGSFAFSFSGIPSGLVKFFASVNCHFRAAENKWSALRCSLWRGEA